MFGEGLGYGIEVVMLDIWSSQEHKPPNTKLNKWKTK